MPSVQHVVKPPCGATHLEAKLGGKHQHFVLVLRPLATCRRLLVLRRRACLLCSRRSSGGGRRGPRLLAGRRSTSGGRSGGGSQTPFLGRCRHPSHLPLVGVAVGSLPGAGQGPAQVGRGSDPNRVQRLQGAHPCVPPCQKVERTRCSAHPRPALHSATAAAKDPPRSLQSAACAACARPPPLCCLLPGRPPLPAAG